MGKRLLIGAAAALGFMALANMLGLGEGFAQMLMILTLILLAVVAFRFFAARKSGASAASAGGLPLSDSGCRLWTKPKRSCRKRTARF